MIPDLAGVIQGGIANPWLYLPAAVLLGALHGLEPGHSKSMMAAFIVAVRGTVPQAILLGICAAISHTATVAVVALGGLAFGGAFATERVEAGLLVLGGLIVTGIALWTINASWPRGVSTHTHDHGHSHDHSHADMPHDAHAAMHEDEIRTRFAGQHVTTPQIALFGLTGGLIPCPAAITVLILCLQLKKLALGAVMVGAFSIGLALTLVTVGVAAAWGSRRLEKQMSSKWLARLPLMSGFITLALGAIMLLQGLRSFV